METPAEMFASPGRYRPKSHSESEINLLDETRLTYNTIPKENNSNGHVSFNPSSKDNEKPKYKNGIFGASCNTINSIIGSGIIGMPFAIYVCGIGLGTLLLVFMGILTDYSLLILIKCGELSGDHTYPGVVKSAYGKIGFILVCISQALNPFLAMISYNIVLGDTVTEVIIAIAGEDSFRDSFFGRREFYIIMGNVFVMLPVSLYRNVAYLAKFAALSIFMIIFFSGFLLYKAVSFSNEVTNKETDWDFARLNLEFLQGLGIMGHAYICHHNAFLVYDSMKNSTYKTWKKVVHISIIFVVCILTLVGVTGYYTFKSFTQGDILNNFCYDDIPANIVRLMFTVNVMLTYPLENFVVRDVFENSIFLKYQPQPLWRHTVETLLTTITAGAIALSTNCVSIVLAINGVITATPLIFFFPTMSYIKLKKEKLLSKGNIVPCSVIGIGTIILLVGTYQIILDISKGITCSDSFAQPYCLSNINTTVVPINVTMS